MLISDFGKNACQFRGWVDFQVNTIIIMSIVSMHTTMSLTIMSVLYMEAEEEMRELKEFNKSYKKISLEEADAQI